LQCWVFCPDSSILLEDGEVVGINYEHCKGCGICVEECPRTGEALRLVSENDEAS
jgi:pyruvate ferredoxin oxidoreductase delta subunit